MATSSVLSTLAWAPADAQLATSATIVVASTSASETDGACGLFEAMVNANNNDATYPECDPGAGDDTIEFDIPGTGPFLIDVAPTAGLPAVTGTLTIDGTTQPGWTPGNPVVEVDNQSVPAFPVLDLSASTNSVVRGLVLNNPGPSQPIIHAGNGSVISGNWIGLHADGSPATEAGAASGVLVTGATGVQIGSDAGDGSLTSPDGNVISNSGVGVYLSNDGGNIGIRSNRIGTNPDGDAAVPNINGIEADISDTGMSGLEIVGNVISGNTDPGPGVGHGILLDGWVFETVIQGNLIGTDATATFNVGNDVGIAVGPTVGSVEGTQIGGPGGTLGNEISGNRGEAIALGSFSTATTVFGNRLGVVGNNNTSPSVESLTVPGDAVMSIRASSNNIVGATTGGFGNEIRSTNGRDAVWIESGSGNEVTGNTFVTPGALMVDLAPDGFNANDIDDLDAPQTAPGIDDPSFPNNLQNFAEIDVRITEGDLVVDYVLDSDTGSTNYPATLDVYKLIGGFDGPSTVEYLGSGSIPFPDGGNTTIGNADALNVLPGDAFIAAVRDANGNTSEDSGFAALPSPSTFFVNSTGDDSASDAEVSCEIYPESGECTLRSAIQAAEANPGPDTILFDFPGTAPVTITPASSLPSITEPLTIDGLSAANTSCAAWPPTLRIAVNVSNSTGSGLRVDNGSLTLRGVVLNGTPAANLVYLESNSSGSVFECNFFGTDVTGTAVVGSSQDSIWFNQSNGNRVGGVTDSHRNLFAGNTGEFLWMASANGNVVDNNWFGVDVSGTARLGTANGAAISISGSNNVIGHSSEAPTGNLIARRTSNAPAIEVWRGGAPFNTGNTIRGNSIFGNAGIGIDLVDSSQATTAGVTFNHVGVIPGPNEFQNFPVLTLATTDGTTTRVAGYLPGGVVIDDGPVTDYRIDVYSSRSCDATSFGEGEQFIGSFVVQDFSVGSVSFDDNTLGAGFGEPAGVTATATNLDTGSTSEFSYCRPVSTTNLNWVQAQPSTSGSTTSQYIAAPLMEKWFSVPPAGPGAQVTVTVNGVPGTAVSLHTDPHEAYNNAINPNSAVALAAEAADVGFLPSGSLPSGSLPSGSLPSGSLPSGSLPSGSLETGFLPSGSLPSGSLPSGSLPSGSLPSGSLPSGSLPSGSLPSGSLPSGSLPSGSLPSGSLPSGSLPSGSLPSGSLPSGSLPSGSLDAYSTASRRSLLAFSANPWSSTQTIERNTFDYAGALYVRVVGPFDLQNPFEVTVTVEGGVCEALTPPSGPDIATPAGINRSTVILTDSSRLQGTPAQIAQAIADLQTLAARPDVNGAVVDLAGAARVVDANAKADAVPNCAFAKNNVAAEIKKVVEAFRVNNPIEYVVLAGGAEVIPFHQVSDVGGLANEREYVPPVAPNTPTDAGLRSGLVKGQDYYGASTELNVAGRAISVPDLAVGRLVDNAADVSTAVNAYIATGGTVSPSSALVTGYDFVGDAAATVNTEFAAATDNPTTSLIQAPGLDPTDPTAWSANQLRPPLLSGDHDLFMLTGHFSAGKLLAADYRTTISAAEVAGTTDQFTDAVVLALGCHAGFSLPSTDLIDASPDPDWAKAFLRRGAASFVAATGYAYGDTELEEYGERLFIDLAREMRTGTGPIPMGKALVAAKLNYITAIPQLTGLDEKTLQEMTLYGLPMMKIDMPGARLPRTNRVSAVTGTNLVGPTAPGLSTATFGTNPTVSSPIIKSLENLAGGPDVPARYQTGPDGVVARPFEPILPKQIDRVDATGVVLRGVALRGGTYTDENGITPFTSAPTTETSRPIQAFESDVFVPTQVFSPNFFAAVNGGSTQLVTTPQQYRSSAPGSITGTLRTWQSVNYGLYYLPDTWNTDPDLVAYGVTAAPAITGVSAAVEGDQIVFSVNATADGIAGVHQVWVLVTATSGAGYGTWAPVDLVPGIGVDGVDDPTLWTGSIPLSSFADASAVRFMVQAVGGAGLTTLSTNNGAYFQVGVSNTPAPDAAETTTVVAGPTTGRHGVAQTFTATVTSNDLPVAGTVVEFEIAGQRVLGVTGASGVASVVVTPFSLPGAYEVRATARGSATQTSSEDSQAFEITETPVTLDLGREGTTAVASLGSPDGGLGGKPVVFTIVSTSGTTQRVIATDNWGEARLTAVGLPFGVYTVSASFGSGTAVDLDDPVYGSASTPTIEIALGDEVPPTITATATANGNPYVANAWTNANVVVSFACADTGGSGLASCTSPQTVTASTAQVTGEAVDNAGNRTTAVFGPIRIDKVAPTVAVTQPAANASYTVGQAVTAAYTCTDADSGVATCTGTVANGAAIDTATAGAKSVTVTSTDNAGNTTTRTISYTVTAPPTGNVAPTVTIDMGVNGLQEIGFREGLVVLTGRFSDPDGRGPYTASVRWQAGGTFSPLAVAFDGSVLALGLFGTPGARTVTVRVCDRQGACGTDDIIVRPLVTTRVTPVMQCVADRRPATPRYRATFGYDNPASFAIATLPLLDNVVVPGLVRGQPAVLLPGSRRNVFTVDFASGTVSWLLNGNVATARANSPRC